jgi:hypothetical protein
MDPLTMSLIASGIGAGTSLLGSLFGGRGNASADIQKLIKWQKSMYERLWGALAPYRGAGRFGLSGLQAMLEEGYDITRTPMYGVMESALDRELRKGLSARGLQYAGFGVEESSRLHTNLMTQLFGQRASMLEDMAKIGTAGYPQAPNLEGYARGLLAARENEVSPFAMLGSSLMSLGGTMAMAGAFQPPPSFGGTSPMLTAPSYTPPNYYLDYVGRIP